MPPIPQNQSSALAIGYNEGLSTEILLRLPPKSVLNFKTVSKLWLTIVSSPRFRRLHASRCRPNPSPTGLLFLVVNGDRFGSSQIDFDYVPLLKSDNNNNNNHCHISSYIYKIKGTTRELSYRSSCNGLQLYKSYDYDDYKFDGEYYVINPTTKEFKIIRIPPILRNTNQCVDTTKYLAFDPSQSPHYKIVMVSLVDNKNKLEIDVYSSENEFCSPERNTSSFDLDHTTTPPYGNMQEIFCNGIIHLLGSSWTSMLCFDFNKQSFIKCSLPSGPPRSSYVHYHIKQSRGTIYLVVGTGIGVVGVSPLHDVHELKRDYSGWFLKYQLDLTSIAIDCQRNIPNFPSPDGHCIFMMAQSITWLSNLCEEDGEGPTMVFVACDQLVAYNLTRKTTKIIVKVNARLLDYNVSRYFQEVFPHIDTLAIV